MGSKLQISSGHCVSDASFGEGENNRMRDILLRLYVKLQVFREDHGQDLIEYTLLMAFVALASAALFIGAGGSVKGIWSSTAVQLTAANTAAS